MWFWSTAIYIFWSVESVMYLPTQLYNYPRKLATWQAFASAFFPFPLLFTLEVASTGQLNSFNALLLGLLHVELEPTSWVAPGIYAHCISKCRITSTNRGKKT